MSDLDQTKLELEAQKSRLIGTVDEIRQELAAQKVGRFWRSLSAFANKVANLQFACTNSTY